MSLETSTLGGAAVLLLCVYAASCAISSRRKYSGIPKANPRLPFLGNAGSLDMSRCHIVLAEWAKRFGPVFRIKIFAEEILVLSSYESVHDALVQKNAAFAGRPPMYRTSQQNRNKHSVVWQTYTPKLQFLRRETAQTLKVYGGGLDLLEQRCAPELQRMRNRIQREAKAGRSFDPFDVIYDAVCNVMLRITLDTNFEHEATIFKTIRDMNRLFNDTFSSGSATALDLLPWLCELRGHDYANRLKQALKMRDDFWEKELTALKERQCKEGVVPRMLQFIATDKGKKHDITEDTAKEVFTNLILAGTDTTSTALTCLLLLFLHYPEVQEKMRAELSDSSDKQSMPKLSGLNNMPYSQAVLLELLRYISHVPLAVPHYTMYDTSVLGIPVPKDMTVYVNLWSIHHDRLHWPEPWTFKPNRFLDSEGNIYPPTHPIRRKLLAFGAGRRVCLGEAFAKHRLFIFALFLVKHFRFLPSDEDNRANRLPPVDPRTYEMGLVLHPHRFHLKAEIIQ
ncbi:cytochrome p450 1a1 [Plakobranchus ocellatus]|uniref:Cytochrome p450 1a1 n=1 Tax=Plakobranchus ocellatus TaxID=259542 RepID=A0AAV4C2T2_9GAST|nr:cytochrome p450 1a1 [Plakobranchus ocellatus]